MQLTGSGKLVMDNLGPIMELIKLTLARDGKCLKHHRILEEYMDGLKTKSEELNCRKEDVESRITTELLSGKTLKKEVQLWLESVERINSEINLIEEEVRKVKYISRVRLAKCIFKKMEELKKLHQKGSFPDSLVVDAPPVIGMIFPTETLAGETTSKRIMEEIWACLMNENIQKIGVYGMGGSGKTTIMEHVFNLFLERTDRFKKLIWVIVSKDINVIKLQHEIAREFHVELSNIEDDKNKGYKIIC